VSHPENIDLKQTQPQPQPQPQDAVFAIRDHVYDEIPHLHHETHGIYIHPSDLLDAHMHVFDPYERLQDEGARMTKYV